MQILPFAACFRIEWEDQGVHKILHHSLGKLVKAEARPRAISHQKGQYLGLVPGIFLPGDERLLASTRRATQRACISLTCLSILPILRRGRTSCSFHKLTTRHAWHSASSFFSNLRATCHATPKLAYVAPERAFTCHFCQCPLRIIEN
jgi:hypothetical protein